MSAIDQAEAKLRGLGNSTKTVAKIMDNALASVKGTAFGLGDAATVAAQVVAAGVKPGRELQRTLKLTADAATIAGVSLTDMGSIFGKVAASNKIQGDVINQLNDAGVPIIQLLGKEMGKTSAQVTALASKGKIDFKTFQNAMEGGLGGAALKSGNTFKGALANMYAALGRFGAGLLTGLFPIAKQVFGNITIFLDSLTKRVTPLANAFSAKLPAAFSKVASAVSGLVSGGGGKLKPLIDSFVAFAASVLSAGQTAAPALLTIAHGLAPIVKLAAGVAIVGLTVAFRVLGPAIEAVATALAGTVNFVSSNQTGFKILAGIIGAIFLPVLIQSTVALIAQKVNLLLTNAAWIAYGIATKAVAIGTQVLTAAQWLLNAALTANPIGLVIVGLVALGAALVLLWTKSSTFRAIVTGAFHAVLGAASAAFGWIRGHWPLLLAILAGPFGLAALVIIKNFDRIVSFARGIPGKIRGAFAGAGGWLISAGKAIIGGLISGITSKLGALGSKLGSVGSFIKSHKGPPSYDRVMLTPAGKQIMQGLMGGIESQLPSLGGTLNKVNSTLQSGVAIPAGARFHPVTSPAASSGQGALVARLHPDDIADIINGLASASDRIANGVADRNTYKDTIKTRMPGIYQGATA